MGRTNIIRLWAYAYVVVSKVYDKVILDVQIDQLTIPWMKADLKATCWSRVIPSSMLGQKIG